MPGFRERVEEALGGVALDAYGTSELGIVAGERPEKDGLWEIPEMAVLEVLDPETLRPVADGEKGELVVTALSRTLMPMVRFRTGDLAVAERREGLTVLPRGVFGRTDQMVKVKGVKLYPTELAPVLAGFGLDPKGFQVVVERKLEGTDKLVLRLKAEKVPPASLRPSRRPRGSRWTRWSWWKPWKGASWWTAASEGPRGLPKAAGKADMTPLEAFQILDLRVGRVLRAEPHEKARKPSYKLWVDLGPLGVKQSSAQITELYRPEDLVGRLVVCAVNLGAKRVAGFLSEVLVLGVPDEAGRVVLLAPDREVPLGGRCSKDPPRRGAYPARRRWKRLMTSTPSPGSPGPASRWGRGGCRREAPGPEGRWAPPGFP